MDHKQYLDNHNLRCADRHCCRHNRQYGKKEKAGQIGRLQLRQLQELRYERLMS